MEQLFKELSEKHRELFFEVVSRFEETQQKHQQQLKELKVKSNDDGKVRYLEGVVDGINLIVEPMKKYRDS